MMKWTAVYDNGEILEQYDGPQERMFREINQDRLKLFVLNSENNYFTIDLKTGDFFLNKVRIDTNDTLKDLLKALPDKKFKLIYFKRTQRDLGGSIVPRIKYFIGWQISTPDTSYKRIYEVSDDIITTSS